MVDAEEEVSGAIFKLPARLGRYTLMKRLGVGGMAEAFLAQQDGPAGFQKKCVVKRILPHLGEDRRFVEMFLREARVAAMLSHTNIVQIYDLGDVDGVYFIAMELVDGAPLHHLARSAWRARRSLPIEVVTTAIADAALGLHYAHTQVGVDRQPLGIVHRDISPDNLIINREGVTKVVDFGVAKLASGERTATGELKGKLPFLSPEQIQGEPVDHRVDIYALGVTLYWLLTGKRPFSAPTDLALMQRIVTQKAQAPSTLNPSIPEFLDALILKLLEKDPAQRVQTAGELHDMLSGSAQHRRTLVAPFVVSVLDAEDANADETEPDAIAPGFLPATPHTDEVKAGWRRLQEVSPVASTQPLQPVPIDIDSPTVISTSISLSRSRSQKAGIAIGAALALAAAIGIAVVVTSHGDEEAQADGVVAQAPLQAPPQTPPEVVPPAPAEEEATEPEKPVEASPPEPVEAPPEQPPDDKTEKKDDARATSHRRERPAMRSVDVQAPREVRWETVDGKPLGAGNAKLSLLASVSTIIAVNTKTGGRTRVSVDNAPINYAALPKGRLHPRANPFADVHLGTMSLGTTPFAPVEVVAGTYEVRFVHEGKTEKRVVEVKRGQVMRVAVDFDG